MPVPFADLQLQYQTIKDEIDGAIAAVIRENAFIRGPYVDAFEREFADAVDVKHCISCANGTDAIYLALAALKVQPGDEVITTAHSWISTSAMITHAGATPVFFFFQAEDGIRDLTVTGVQTCALPISPVMAATGTNGSAARTACPLRGTSPS